MPFMGDSRRRQLRRLSNKSTASSVKTDGSNSDSTPNTPRSTKSSSKHSAHKITPTKAIAVPPRSVPQTPRKAPVNVFSFMEEDEQGIDMPLREEHAEEVPGLSCSPDSASSTTSSHRDIQSPYSDLEVHAGQKQLGYLWSDKPHNRGDSMHSDSGVSMLSSSVEEESPVLGYRSRFAAFDESTPTVTNYRGELENAIPPAAPELSGHHVSRPPSLDTRYVEEPETYYVPSPVVPTRTPRTATFYPPQGLQPTMFPSPPSSGMKSMDLQVSPMPEVKKSGYDLLASSIGSGSDALLTPIYRKFETLNNRILLYLQDEISEMEDNLKGLDAAIAQEEGSRTASRRSDPMYPSQLKWHRQELMCRIFSKVEQYNLALSSYSNLATSLKPASNADIDAYRAWIVEHAPLVEQETDFLQNESDLMTVARLPVQNTRQPDPTPIIAVAIVFVSTIIVFKVVPQILARLAISAVVGMGGLCTLAPKIMDDVSTMREWKRATGLYAAIMLVLAIVVG